jgi:hypothetical protein
VAAGAVPDVMKIIMPVAGVGTNAVRAVSLATTGSIGGTENATSVAFTVILVATTPAALLTLKSIFDGTTPVDTVLLT